MKINNISKTHHKAGLTTNISKRMSSLNLGDLENSFILNYNIDARFKNNAPRAFCNLVTRDILKQIFPICAMPPAIRCYNKNELNYQFEDFCISENSFIFNKEPPFKARSIFFSKKNSLEEINEFIEKSYSSGKNSSPHFLADTMHEWLHAIHLFFIKYKQHFSSKNLINTIEAKRLSDKDRKITEAILGTYSTNSNCQFMEIYAETLTQVICNSLSADLNLNSDPFEEIKKYPKEFQDIFNNTIYLI